MSQLDEDWRAVCRSPASRAALRRLCEVEPDVAAVGATDLGELVRALRPPLRGLGARRPEERVRPAVTLRAMLRSQGVHPLVPRAILQAILPGLVGVARRLSWGTGGEWGDGGSFFVDAISTAWEVIVEWSGEDREYAVLDLLSAVRCRLRRQLLRHRAQTARADPTPSVDAVRPVPCGLGASDLDELAHAIDGLYGSGIAAADAAVLYAHGVLGYSMTELAAVTGRSRRHLGARRDRAARTLIA